MNEISKKTGLVVVVLLLVTGVGYGGYIYGIQSATQETDFYTAQFSMFQEILVEIKTLQQDLQKQTNQLNQQLTALTYSCGNLKASGLANIQVPPKNTEVLDKATLRLQREQKMLEKEQSSYSEEAQERKERDLREAVEWTDSLDPDSLPSDG